VTRVAVVAYSPAVRAGLAALLGGYPGFIVLETAALPGDIAVVAELVEADVIVLALDPGDPWPLPVVLPPDAAGRAPAVVVLGDDSVDGWIAQAVRSGARAALPRTATAEQIASAVAAVAAGLLVLPADSGPAVLPRAAVRVDHPPQPLTPREAEVLGMLAEGLGNKVIATRCGISEHTVKTHVAAVFAKLGVSTRAEAVASAARAGLLML
jgi:two-component system, NarL family, response regulator YdfI